LSPGERRRLLGLLGFLTFNAVYVGVVMAPVLTQIAGEFSITTGTAGLVVQLLGNGLAREQAPAARQRSPAGGALAPARHRPRLAADRDMPKSSIEI